MFKGRKVSVVMPAYNEEPNIENAVREFKRLKYVDEVVVVDNNSTDRTAELARKTGARVVSEKRQGYGYACRRALKEAKGYYIVLVEPDGTFDPEDILKFLAYSKDFDFVLGTRTTKELIWKGSNMDWFLRWGNWVLSKMVELLYNGPHLSDVGCTYRLIKKRSLERIQDRFTVGGSHFSPEMMILALKNRIRTIEIPVNYKPRRGESKITGERKKAFKLGLRMIRLIIGYLFK
ncbi:MAG: glycosyltransferase family 2 protein [Candidatus Aenigmarchaeota archaeon]|nr:glycosyltransferase family 2 protein [Candidatus Aenigmarchaeota archaeon]